MKYATTYKLTAYDVDTHEQVFSWPIVVDNTPRPSKDDNITGPDERQFIVIGIHYESTAADWRIDVKPV